MKLQWKFKEIQWNYTEKYEEVGMLEYGWNILCIILKAKLEDWLRLRGSRDWNGRTRHRIEGGEREEREKKRKGEREREWGIERDKEGKRRDGE